MRFVKQGGKLPWIMIDTDPQLRNKQQQQKALRIQRIFRKGLRDWPLGP